MTNVVGRAKAALEGVTEGPWKQVGFGNVQRVPAGDYPPVAKAWKSANGEFIAAARDLVPDLVAEVEKLRELVGLMRDLHRPMSDMGTPRCRECRHDWPCDTSWKLDGLERAE